MSNFLVHTKTQRERKNVIRATNFRNIQQKFVGERKQWGRHVQELIFTNNGKKLPERDIMSGRLLHKSISHSYVKFRFKTNWKTPRVAEIEVTDWVALINLGMRFVKTVKTLSLIENV